MATSGVLRAVLLLLLGLTGTHAASLQISVGEEDVTDTAYFAQVGKSVTFTCKGGSNATWTVSSLPVRHSDRGNGLYQSSNNEGGQVLHVLSFKMEQVARYTCKADNSSQAYVELEADILDSVIVLNSTAIMVYWSTTPKIGLVQCCPDGKPCLTATVNTSLDSYVYSGLEEYTRYAVSLRGESRKVFIVTYQDRPSAEPLNIRFFIESSLHMTISWELPVAEDRNGIITSYEINCIVTGSTGSSIITETVYVENPRFALPSEQSYRIHAKLHSTYVCRVSAATVNGSGPASMHSNATVELPKLAISNNGDDSVVVSWDIPHVSGVSSVQSGVSLVYNVLATGGVKTNISVPVTKTEWTISNLVVGVPYEVKVEVGVSNIITASETKVFFTRELEPLVAVEGLSAIAINTTAIQVNWTELSLNKARGNPVYTIHIESKASSWSKEVSAQSIPAIVNGLLPATQYTVRVKVTTAGNTGAGRISSSVSVETKSEGRPTVGPTDGTVAPLVAPVAVGVGVGTAVTVTVIAVGLLVVLACLCILWRSMRGKSYRNQFQEDGKVLFETGNGTPMSSPPAIRESVLFGDRFAQQLIEMQMPSANRESYENTRPPVKVSDFPEYVHRMRVENSFNVEFKNMPKCDASACRSDAESETNKPKNRYQTIVPYNQSRVILSGQSNYINASYVNGYKRAKVYIATQGPLECTVSDFWQMVWEQKCSVIAMLTNLVEGGTAKCHKYWEDELTKPLQLPNGISIQQDEHKIFAEYECRIFAVTHRDHPKLPALTVHHFQYTAWPDCQVPKYPASLVRFVQTVRHVYKDEETPMVVHCSAGVGRTGTFIAIDTMMQRMKERNDINIYEFLYEMRNCRMWLVMTVEQYEFIHEAVCDFAMSDNTYIDATKFDAVLARLKESSRRGGYTAIEEQFQLLDQLSRKPSRKDDIFAKEHMEDNRYETRYPYVSNHVVISKTGESKYINAAPIDSYSKRHAFIAAEIPPPNKIELVLDIIAQKQCSTVVVLCTEDELREVSFCKFWPVEESASMSFGQYSLQLTTKYSKDGFTVLKITLTRTEGHEHQFALIHIHGWTENNEPEPHVVWNAIQEYEKAQKGITAPAIVMCNDGMGRTGAFICMCSEVERMRMEGMADIFQSVKAARNQRPYMVSTVEQYVLIHEVLMCFLKTFQIYDNFGRALARTDKV